MKYSIPVKKSETLKPLPATQNLGFGQYFSDHMFMAEYENDWKNFEIKPYAPIPLDPAASVLHYGQALFEGLKAFHQTNGRCVLFRPEFNAERFKNGAERLCMKAPPSDLFCQAVQELVRLEKRWIPKEKGSALYVRPTLIGTEGFLGVRPSKKYTFFVIVGPVGSYYSGGLKPVKIWVEEKYVRAAPGGIGHTKAAANYAISLKAAESARQKGYSQVLWLDVTHQYVEEVGTMNVFFVVDNEILTPALDETILPGGVRSCVIQLLREWGYKVSERKVSVSELNEAYKAGKLTESFGSGTAAVVTPIGELAFSDQVWKFQQDSFGPVAKRLYDEISGIQMGEIPDRHNWIYPID
jgi:branched-chain amino acid aminotransferase